MKNKTEIVLLKVPSVNFKPVERQKDMFVMKAVNILNSITNVDRHAILHQINDLGKSAKVDYHRTIITILNDRFISEKSTVLPSSSSFDAIDDGLGRRESVVDSMPNLGLVQDFMVEKKTTLDLTSLEDTLQEISALQSTLGQHLQEQSERISVLNVDADQTLQNIDLGNLELQKAIIEMSKSRAWFVYTLCILSSVLLAMDWFYD